MFIKIDTKAGAMILVASVLLVWALLFPESFQSTVDMAVNSIPSVEVN